MGKNHLHYRLFNFFIGAGNLGQSRDGAEVHQSAAVFIKIDLIFGVELDTYILSLFIGVVYIYTHFQLLTNLADIARQDSSEYSIPIRQLRSFVIVGVTITNIVNSFFPNIWLVYGIAIINILIFTILSAQLFSYAKEEQKREELQVN